MTWAVLPVDAPAGLPDVRAMPAGDLVRLWARVLVQGRGLSAAEVEVFAGYLVGAARRLAPDGNGVIVEPGYGAATGQGARGGRW